MSEFVFDRDKLPDVKMKQSVLNSFDDHYVVYDVDGYELIDPSDDDIAYAEKQAYIWIAWYERLKRRISNP
jgi:hypothetical protein